MTTIYHDPMSVSWTNTPLLLSRQLSAKLGCKVYLKLEVFLPCLEKYLQAYSSVIELATIPILQGRHSIQSNHTDIHLIFDTSTVGYWRSSRIVSINMAPQFTFTSLPAVMQALLAHARHQLCKYNAQFTSPKVTRRTSSTPFLQQVPTSSYKASALVRRMIMQRKQRRPIQKGKLDAHFKISFETRRLAC